MITILSHRGAWISREESNLKVAFVRSFSNGFGVETDVRDHMGTLVVAHDVPLDWPELTLDAFLTIYADIDGTLPLALNIKADGLQSRVEELVVKHSVKNYFVFDMSVPDSLGYLKRGLKTYTRQSEYEITPPYLEQATGVWIDEFHAHWIDEDLLVKYAKENRQVCIVSPELHGRTFEEEWVDYKNWINKHQLTNIALCTDLPFKAKEFFNG